jgi:hypothetical protein
MRLANTSLAACLATALAISGCASDSLAGTPSAAENRHQLATSFSPVQSAQSGLKAEVRTPGSDKKAVVFVSTFFTNEVLGFARTGGSPIITISVESPKGLAFDKQSNLYVANGSENVIDVFAPGKTSPSEVIPIAQPFYPTEVAVNSSGDVWITTRDDSSDPSPGNLQEFNNAGTLIQTVSCADVFGYGGGSVGGGIVLDKDNNLFFQGTTNDSIPKDVVEELPAGAKKCKRLPPQVSSNGGLAITSQGDLVVGDDTNYDAFTYAAPQFRKIIAKTNLDTKNGHISSISLALNKNGSLLWSAGSNDGTANTAAQMVSYPHDGDEALAVINIPGSYGGLSVAVNY